MEGCLSALIKLLILAGLFLVGLVTGYLYYLGTFDGYLVKRSFGGMPKITADEAAKLVDPKATPGVAFADPASVDGRWVLWRGTITESTPKGDYTQLTLISSDSSRKQFVVFSDRGLEKSDAVVNDELEVLGMVRRTFVLTEDREGHRYPQVVAISVKKISAPPPSAGGGGELDGEVAASPGAASPGSGPAPSARPSAAPARPAASPGARPPGR